MSLSYLKQFLFLLGDHKRKLIALILLYLLSSLLDIIGIGLIAPFIQIFNENQNGSFFMRWVTTMFPSLPREKYIVIVGTSLVLVFLCKTIASIVINKVNLKFSTSQDAGLRLKLMVKYQMMPYSDFINYSTSEIIQRIRIQTGEFIYNGLIPLFRLISESLITFIILLFLLYTSPYAMLILTILITLLIVFYDLTVKKQIGKAGIDSAHFGEKMVRGIQESLGGFKEVKVLGKQDFFRETVRKSSTLFADSQERLLFLTFIPRYLLELTVIIFMVLFPLSLIFVGGNLTNIFSTLGIFGVAAVRIIPSANIIIQAITTLRYSKPAINAIYEDIKSGVPEIKNNTKTENRTYIPFEYLMLDKISYKYPSASDWALNDISFSIKRGESIGFIGTSGAGKTTLIDVILNLLTPQKGVMIIDGQQVDDSLVISNHFAYIPQQIFLIHESVKKNVALGVEDENIDEGAVYEALKSAKLSEIISNLPEGLDTNLGENGIRLSGGQRQRIALARAFYHNRDIIVMDESTSALDSETEKEIVDNIRLLKGSKTLIIVAHRLTTLKYCDRIYRLEGGRIIEVITDVKNFIT